MRSGKDLDRRTFLKLGAAGTAMAATQAFGRCGASIGAKPHALVSANLGRHGFGSADLSASRSF